MANAVARKGDTSSHGGAITTGAAKCIVEGQPVARVGDILACPIHGPNPIVTGAAKWSVEGHAVARTGSTTACGATIIGGATKTFSG